MPTYHKLTYVEISQLADTILAHTNWQTAVTTLLDAFGHSAHTGELQTESVKYGDEMHQRVTGINAWDIHGNPLSPLNEPDFDDLAGLDLTKVLHFDVDTPPVAPPDLYTKQSPLTLATLLQRLDLNFTFEVRKALQAVAADNATLYCDVCTSDSVILAQPVLNPNDLFLDWHMLGLNITDIDHIHLSVGQPKFTAFGGHGDALTVHIGTIFPAKQQGDLEAIAILNLENEGYTALNTNH